MNKKLFYLSVFLVFSLIFIGQSWAFSYISSIEIIPPEPTPDDSVTVIVKGVFPSGCHSIFKGPQRLWNDLCGNQNIILELSHWWINNYCHQAFIDFAVTFSLGKLPSDSYSVHIVTIRHDLIFENPQISYSDTLLKFTVSPKTYLPENITPLPGEFKLLQNYPNPFNQTTTIGFTLTRSDFVSLNIYDLLGRRVKTLVLEKLPAGYNSVTWNGTDESGKDVASGIYFYELKSGDLTETQKLILSK